MKKWKINQPNKEKSAEFASKCDLKPLVLDVMTSRGFDDFDKLVEFFRLPDLSDPFEIKDMDKAEAAVNKAIDSYDLICVYGDYDCDGVTATTILFNYLESMGANVMYYIPEREAGYGMNIQAVRELHEKDVRLIVTVDNGISAIEEIEEANRLGMGVVVTDHHTPGEVLPNALAIVDPHREDDTCECKNLAGVGVAFKLCAALDGGNYDAVLEQYADICAIGTVGDLVPLIGENRTIVKRGLEYLPNTEILGLDMVMERNKVNKDNITSTDIAFKIAPLINASGRMGSAVTAVKLMTSDDPEDGELYAETVLNYNNERKNVQNEILKGALRSVSENPSLLNHRVLVLAGKDWHHGIVGLTAAKIVEIYSKPVIIISYNDNGEARGSARGVSGFNVYKCLEHCKDVLTKYGGHMGAGGFSLNAEDIDEFRELIYEYCDGDAFIPLDIISADKLLMPEDLTVENIKGLEALEPFGTDNPKPIFAIVGARVDKIMGMSENKHTKLTISYGSFKGDAVAFSCNPANLSFRVGDSVDIIGCPEINSYMGRQSIQIMVKDMRKHGIKQEAYFAAKDCYESLMRGDELKAEFIRKIIPKREELVGLYKLIMKLKETTLDNIFSSVDTRVMNYCKIKICIDIFADKGLLEYRPATGKIIYKPVTKKVNLEESETLINLHKMLKEAEG